MTSEQWTLVKAIYSEALEIDPLERDRWLRKRTQLPAGVVEEVVRLLAASQNATTLAPHAEPDEAERARVLIGQTLLNRFEVVSLLGSGAMGDVYCAFDRSVQETVAFKTIKPHLAERREFIQSLTREVSLARRVANENVCQIRDLHTEVDPPAGPLLFFTMELLPGATLAAELERGAFPLAEAMQIARGIGNGLAAIHARDLIHRDLKPSNVFLVRSSHGPTRAVITDFGLCFDERRPVAETLTAFGPDAVVGTPAYMAPEQLLGKGATKKSDIYAFGVLLFEMVTGRQPFTGETPLAVALRRLQEEAPEPRSITRTLPARWNAVILACLARNPQKRPDNILEVIAALEGRRELPGRRVSRRSVIAGGAVAISGAGVYAFWRARPAPPDPKAEYHLKIAEEFVRQSTRDSIVSGIGELKESVVIDPRYALAWADLADAYCLASTFSAMPSSKALPLAADAAQKALALNNRLGKAHAATAYVQACDLHHWRTAETAYRKAISVDPLEPSPRSWYAAFLGRACRFQEAVPMAESALELEPGSLHFSYRLGTELVRARLFERGRIHMEKFVQLHPAEASGYSLLARADEWLSRFGEAEEALNYADRLPGSDTRSNWTTLFAAEGRLAKAQHQAETLRAGWQKSAVETNVYLYALGALYNAKPEEAVIDAIADVMRQAIQRGDETVLAAASNIYLQGVRSNVKLRPIFRELDFTDS